MNMQTIQIMILLLDGFIKLAPWRNLAETMGRIGWVSRQNVARSLRFATAVFAGLGLIVLASIAGPAFPPGCFVVIPSHVSRGSLVLSYAVSAFYLALALWAGVRWCGGRNARRGGNLTVAFQS